MLPTKKFYPATVLFRDENGATLTVRNALNIIDSFLGYLTITFGTNTEPFSTAVKVAKCMDNILNNKPVKKLTEADLELFIDAWEVVARNRNPENKQQIALNAIFYKYILGLKKHGNS